MIDTVLLRETDAQDGSVTGSVLLSMSATYQGRENKHLTFIPET